MSTPTASSLTLTALPGVPMVQEGDDLATLTAEALARARIDLRSGDVLVVAQKIVSKAEGRTVDLTAVEPSPDARSLADDVDKDPRLVELILRESNAVLRARRGVLIVEHRLGLVLANAGIDHSNVRQADPKPDAPREPNDRCEPTGHHPIDDRVLLLPIDPDRSAAELRASLGSLLGTPPAVIIADSLGRAWRLGTVGVAIGVAGLTALSDQRGEPDLFDRPLRVTEVGHADQLAAAASIVMGQAAEGSPIVHVRGLMDDPPERSSARDLLRPHELDLFR